MILDLNLPRKDGRELLAELKTDPALRQIPVVVLTTSDRHHDIQRSYDLHPGGPRESPERERTQNSPKPRRWSRIETATIGVPSECHTGGRALSLPVLEEGFEPSLVARMLLSRAHGERAASALAHGVT